MHVFAVSGVVFRQVTSRLGVYFVQDVHVPLVVYDIGNKSATLECVGSSRMLLVGYSIWGLRLRLPQNSFSHHMKPQFTAKDTFQDSSSLSMHKLRHFAFACSLNGKWSDLTFLNLKHQLLILDSLRSINQSVSFIHIPC